MSVGPSTRRVHLYNWRTLGPTDLKLAMKVVHDQDTTLYDIEVMVTVTFNANTLSSFVRSISSELDWLVDHAKQTAIYDIEVIRSRSR